MGTREQLYSGIQARGRRTLSAPYFSGLRLSSLHCAHRAINLFTKSYESGLCAIKLRASTDHLPR